MVAFEDQHYPCGDDACIVCDSYRREKREQAVPYLLAQLKRDDNGPNATLDRYGTVK